jgi:FG-GAP repeat
MNSTKRLTAALFTGCLLHAQAIELGKSQTLSSPDQVPAGLSASDWSSIRSAYASGQAGTTTTVTSQEAYVKASNTGEDNFFGSAVAVSGDTVVVGANHEESDAVGVNGDQANNDDSGAGAVYVFVRSGSTWSQQAYLKVSNTRFGVFFGSSVAVSGDTVVVGARSEKSNINKIPGK